MKSFAVGLCGFLVAVSFESPSFALDEGFYPPSQLPKKNQPLNLDRAVSASYQLDMMMGSCSGSFISNDGYFLTASHCVELCAEDGNIVKQYTGKNPSYEFIEYTQRQPKNLTCEVFSLPELKYSKPKLVYVGKGYSGFNDPEIETIPADIVSKFKNDSGDYAILKFDVSGKMNCIPRAKNPVLRPGDKVWAVGYPGRNARKNGMGSDGKTEYISYGTVTSSMKENQYYQEAKFTPQRIELLNSIYDANGTQFFSDMDIYSGDSGSMAINASGELVGVNVAGAIPGGDTDNPPAFEDRFLSGTAISVRLTSIESEIRAVAGDQAFEQMFNCQK